MKNRVWKRLLAVAMAVCLCAALVPGAMAANGFTVRASAEGNSTDGYSVTYSATLTLPEDFAETGTLVTQGGWNNLTFRCVLTDSLVAQATQTNISSYNARLTGTYASMYTVVSKEKTDGGVAITYRMSDSTFYTLTAEQKLARLQSPLTLSCTASVTGAQFAAAGNTITTTGTVQAYRNGAAVSGYALNDSTTMTVTQTTPSYNDDYNDTTGGGSTGGDTTGGSNNGGTNNGNANDSNSVSGSSTGDSTIVNEDGSTTTSSTTTTTDPTTGAVTSTTTSTTTGTDGTVTESKVETTTNTDGSSTSKTESTTTEANGTKTEEKTTTTIAKDGSSTTTTTSNSTANNGTKTNTETTTTVDANGKVTEESTTTSTDYKNKATVTTTKTETTVDASGKETAVTNQTITAPDGKETTVVSTTETTTDSTGKVTATTNSTTTDPDGKETTFESKTETTTDAATGKVTATTNSTTTDPDGGKTTVESKTETTTDAATGTTTAETTSTTTKPDGTTEETNSKTETATDDAGTVTETTTGKTETKGATGEVTATTESSSNTTTTADGTMNSTAESTTIYANGDKAESKTEAVSTADGASKETTTETMTTAEGVTTSKETVNATNAEGTSASKVTTVDENGDSKTVAEAAISQVALDAAAESGEPATLPIEIWATDYDSEEEIPPVVTLTLPEGSSGGLVTIPVENMNISTVLVVTLADGTKQIINQSMMTEDGSGLIFELTDDMTVEVVDNHQDYGDVDQSRWDYSYIDYGTSHKSFDGTGNGKFNPDGTMTYDELLAMAAKKNNAYDDNAANWYDSGNVYGQSIGFSYNGNGTDAATFEDSIYMQWLMAGCPQSSKNHLDDFVDGDKVSEDKQDAMNWAIDGGIVNGNEKKELNAQKTVTRGQEAAVDQRVNESNLGGRK